MDKLKKILIVVGTRPEVIKMYPVFIALLKDSRVIVETLRCGQHSDLLDQAFDSFNWMPNYTLVINRSSSSLADLYGQILIELGKSFLSINPDLVVVHGDTATTSMASMTSFLHRIPFAHVEAGLRSGSFEEPWPEEFNRRMTDLLADFYFVPTIQAKNNLLCEGIIDSKIIITGNTVVDSVIHMSRELEEDPVLSQKLEDDFSFLDNHRPIILLTGHRRENFGENHSNVFAAMLRLTKECNCQVVFPVHPNPQLQAAINDEFRNCPYIHLLPPVNYPVFVYLMMRCKFIVSDSGGIQEEAPTFGKKVIVTRNVTERPEGIAAGFLELVGCDEVAIINSAKLILNGNSETLSSNPYGDGQASKRISKIIGDWAVSKE